LTLRVADIGTKGQKSKLAAKNTVLQRVHKPFEAASVGGLVIWRFSLRR
jgi:hypothetical protein